MCYSGTLIQLRTDHPTGGGDALTELRFNDFGVNPSKGRTITNNRRGRGVTFPRLKHSCKGKLSKKNPASACA